MGAEEMGCKGLSKTSLHFISKGIVLLFSLPIPTSLSLHLTQGMPMSPLPLNLTQPQSSPAQTSRALTALVTSSRRQVPSSERKCVADGPANLLWGLQHFHSITLPTAVITGQYYCRQAPHITSLGEVPNIWSPLRTIRLHRTTLKS